MALAWDRLPEENYRAYLAFLRYCELGPERSTAKLRDEMPGYIGDFEKWCTRYKWVSRAQQWDDFQDKTRLVAVNKAVYDVGYDWASAREQWRIQEMRMAEALVEKAFKMLQWPLEEITMRRDGDLNVTIIKPTKWKLEDAAKFLDLASSLVRKAAEMPDMTRQKVVDRDIIRQEAEQLAKELGIPVDDLLADARNIAARQSA